MKQVALLDCTLRDGGYVNEWHFGADAIGQIAADLTEAGIDFIEMGFFQSAPYRKDTTQFRYITDAAPFIPADRKKSKFYGMITFGKYDLQDIPLRKDSLLDGFRIIFKKHQQAQALEYCRAVKAKGYEIFINPMHTYSYSDLELLNLLRQVNDIGPVGFSIVDTMGVMQADNLVRMFLLIDHNLSPEIKVCFHSHNNLQQAFTNATALLACRTSRDLVLDISVMGMGRGAGNLNAELMISHLNGNYGTQYNLLPIFKIADEYISKIYRRSPWGYNLPYFVAASVRCHPNYASYLIEKQTVSIEATNAILSRIPNSKKMEYDQNFIKRLYLDYQEHPIDDTLVLEKLKQQIGDRPVLIIAPGKTIQTHKKEIDAFLGANKPFVFSLNFKPEHYAVDTVFISNAKRFAEYKGKDSLVITSNIQADGIATLNYSSYLNDSEMYDNSALMLCSVLLKLGIREVFFAGLDGFAAAGENYANAEMINNAKLGEFDKRNEIMSQMLNQLSKRLKLRFITPSRYNERQDSNICLKN